MMKFVFVCALVIVGVSAYNPHLSDLDTVSEEEITQIMQDKAHRGFYIDCLLDKSPCRGRAVALKRVLEMYEPTLGFCYKCSLPQKRKVYTMLGHLQQLPEYTAVSSKYKFGKIH